MEFWVAVLVIAFVVREMFTSRYRSQLDDRFANITNRLRRMESEVDALRAHARLVTKADVRPADAIPRSVTSEPLANARVIVVDAPPPPEKPSPAPPKPATPVQETVAPPSVQTPPAPSPTPRANQSVPLTPASVPDWVRKHPITREAAPPRPPQEPLLERLRSSFALEEKLGANYLAKLGVASLVIGVALFLIYQFGGTPVGKVFLGYLGGTLGLGGGLWLERKERYRLFARSLMGGGWSLLYFTTYAMYHVPAARILNSQLLDLLLLLAVAACMVAHSLAYRSQVVTSLAFTLAFLTVTISHSDVYSLGAGVVLALALVVITARLRWFELEVFGLLAAYINHFLWLFPYNKQPHALSNAVCSQHGPARLLLGGIPYLLHHSESHEPERGGRLHCFSSTQQHIVTRFDEVPIVAS